MMGDLDIDLEELECRLYSQVYHASVENYENQHAIPSVLGGANTLRLQNLRYFRTQPRQSDSNNLIYIPRNNNAQHSSTKLKLQAADFFVSPDNVNVIPTAVSDNNNESTTVSDNDNELTSESNNKSPSPIINDKGDQSMELTNLNNTVSPQNETEIISNGENLDPSEMNTNLVKFLNKQSCKQRKKQNWIERLKRKRKNRRKLVKELQGLNDFTVHYLNQNDVPTSNSNPHEEIVMISDSDSNDSCIEIPQKRDLVVVSDESDTENGKNCTSIKSEKTTTGIKEKPAEAKQQSPPAQIIEIKNLLLEDDDDDVLFLGDFPTEVEIIDLDCDSKSVTNPDDNKQSSEKSLETNSTNSFIKRSANTHLQKSTLSAKERKELLRTPDSTSTSNDFLDNSIDLQQKRFNFAQHGSDFDNSDVFVKPKSSTDIYETESSCSASDIGTPVKNNMFHEVEFDTPQKDLFNEENLQAFGEYITPNRNKPGEKVSSSDKFKQVLTKASGYSSPKIDVECSDTSSESDYDGNVESRENNGKRKLPNLSIVDLHTSTSQNKSPDSRKKLSEDSVCKRQKHAGSETLTVPIKKMKNDDSVIEITSTGIVEIDDSCDLDENVQLIVDDECVIEPPKSRNSEVFSISDEEVEEDIDVGTDIQLSNCKAAERPPDKVREPDKITGFLKHWTSDIDKFHNTSWGLENFNVKDAQKTMSDDQKLWKILEEDRCYYRMGVSRGRRCLSCKLYGHSTYNCPNGRGPIVCPLCGQTGHREPRCPNAICTLCGSEGGYGTYCSYCANWIDIQCRICGMAGHIEKRCPDLWRRYHLTTEPGPIVKPSKNTYKNQHERWCSGCARSGHYEYRCYTYNRTHSSVDPNVKEYYDIYNFPKNKPFILRHDLTEPRPKAITAREPERSENKTNASTGTVREPKPSTSRAVPESPKKSNQIKKDAVKILTDLQKTETESIEIIDVVNCDDETAKNYCSLQAPFDASIFPPIEMIPPYFQKYLEFERESKNANVNTDPLNTIPDSWKDQKFVRNPAADDFKTPKSIASSPNSVIKTIDLNSKQLGFMESEHGTNFIKKIQSDRDVTIDTKQNNDGPYPDGVVTIRGKARDVRYIQREVHKFANTIPKLSVIPMQSKAACNLLTTKLGKLEKIVGNCKSLYKNLLKLQLQMKGGGNLCELRTQIKSTKIQLNMLLFGKLALGEGEKHVCNLQRWRNEFAKQEDHPIPFNTMFNMLEAYSYIFLDTVNHEYKNFCAVKKYDLSQSTKKHLQSALRYFKLVEAKCHQFRLSDELQRLRQLNAAMYNSNFSVKAFKEYMTFCHKILRWVKLQTLQ